jgi:hypothetical protein
MMPPFIPPMEDPMMPPMDPMMGPLMDPMMPPPMMPPMGPPPGGGMMPGPPMVPGLPPIPQPMGPPTTPVTDLLAALRELGGIGGQTEARYPRWYKKPDKPEINNLWGKAQQMKQRFRLLHDRIHDDMLWLRLAQVGMFEEDVQAMRDGLYIDKFQSTALVDEWNLVCAFLAGLQWKLEAKMVAPDLQTEAQRIKDTVAYLRQQEILRHAEAGQGNLAMDEARMLTAYGMIVNRTVIDLEDPDFPFDSILVDPSTVFPEWNGKRGLFRVWRVYKTTWSRVLGDYGEPSKKELKKIRNLVGENIDDETEIEIVEYWDTWYRAVLASEAVILPLTEHKYGYVPFTIQYGPLGEPMGVLSPTDGARRTRSGEWVADEGSLKDDLPFKALSYIGHMKHSHKQYEAIMARMLTGFKKAINPPLLRERDEMAADQPMPEMDTGPGAINETMLGHERVSPIPTQAGPIEVSAVMEAMSMDRMTGRAPLAMYGLNDRSNVSGTALQALNDAGMDKVGPWVAALEQYHTRRFNQWLISWRNFGHLAKYAGDSPSPFMIPVAAPKAGMSAAFELTPEVVDAIGPRMSVSLTRVRKQEWLPMLNAAKMAYDIGVMTKRQIADEIGALNYEEIVEEVIEDKMLDAALQHPKFAEMFGIPQAMVAEMKEAENNPRIAERYKAMLDAWMEKVAMPSQQQAPAPGGPGGGAPGGLPPELMALLGGQGGPPNPNTSAGVSFPQLGQGPGSVTGQQGGQPAPNMTGMPNSLGLPGSEM